LLKAFVVLSYACLFTNRVYNRIYPHQFADLIFEIHNKAFAFDIDLALYTTQFCVIKTTATKQ